MDNFANYDSKPYTLGGIAAGVLGWMATGSLGVGLGLVILGFRLAARQEELADANVIDAAHWALPPSEPRDPVSAIQNNVTVSSNVTVAATPDARTPRAASVISAPVPEDSQTDIPAQIVEAIVNDRSPGHVFLSCRTGSGKTTTVRAMIRRMLESEDCQFLIADPKGSQWMGLEKINAVCRIRGGSVEPNEGFLLLMRWLQEIREELNDRIDRRLESGEPTTDPRVVLVLDEWPTIWGMARDAKTDGNLLSMLNDLVRLGREDRINVWIVGQSHLVTESGFSRTTQQNFEMVALGRGDNLESVRAMASDSYVVRDPRRRQDLLSELDLLGNPQTPIAFTSAGGGRICQLPDLRAYTDWQIPDPC